MKSIRAYLLTGVSLLVMLALLASTWLSFNRAHYEVDELFDAELAKTARVLRSTLSMAAQIEDNPTHIYSRIVSTHDWAGRSSGEDEHEERTRFGHSYERKIMFKILRGNKVVLASDNSPEGSDFPREQGYHRFRFDQHDWYLFTLVDKDIVYVVGERSDVREELITKIALSYLYPALLTLPLLLVMLAWTLQRGLQPLVSLDKYIQQRDKDNLDPIEMENSPREIKPIIESLNGLLARLRRSLDNERRFTATASHEMRTPIAVLKLNVQNALKATTETERLQLLQELDISVDRTGRLINQLLALNRLEQDVHGFDKHVIDLLPVLREEIAALYPLAMEKSQSVELFCDESQMPLNTIPQLFSLLVRNLVDNAIKYSPENGRVLVTASRRDKELWLQIEDSGPGVPEEQRTRVFERFYRITNSDVPGSGLGLAIVRRALELLGGTITLDRSGELGGLSVTIRLPT